MAKTSQQVRTALQGISGILVTPFDGQDVIAPNRLTPIIDRVVNAGVDNVVANGNTSEFYALQAKEAETMMHEIVQQVAGRIPVINGVGRSVGEACALAKASCKAGVDAIMGHQPPDPFVAPRGIIDYVQRVAEAANGLPIVLYLRNDSMGMASILELAAMPQVIGVKWATPSVLLLAALIREMPEKVVWVCGLAEVWAPAMASVGAQGFTSGLINVWPEQSVTIRDAIRKGNILLAREKIDEIADFEAIRAEELSGTNVTGVKAALQIMGHDCGHVRAPGAWPLTEDQQQRMKALLKNVGVLS